MKNKSAFLMALTATIMLVSILASAVPVTAQSDEGLFTINIIAPGSANMLRRQWGLIIANSFQSVGIDANVVFLGWGAVIDRVFEPLEDMMGKIYTDGGFDAQLIGWTPGNPALPFSGSFQIYHSANLPPDSNYMLWKNATADAFIDDALSLGYTAEGIAAFKNWQAIQYEDLPASQIHYSSVVFTAANDLNFSGWEWIFDNIATEPERLVSSTGRTQVVEASTGELKDLLPPISNSWYDTIVYAPVFDALFNINTTFQYPISDSLCTAYTSSADGTEHTYTLRQGILFHDGVEMDADDVLFTFLANLNPATGSYFSSYTSGFMGDDISFKWLNGTTTRLILDNAGGTYSYPATPTETSGEGKTVTVEAVSKYVVKVSGANILATYHPSADALFIVPKHVLEINGTLFSTWADWDAHTFNTGIGTYQSNGQTFYGPIGTGPYVYKGYDVTGAINTLDKFTNYWNRATLEAGGQFGVEKFYIRYIVEKDPAIAALKNDEVQILSAQYMLQRDAEAGNLGFATNYDLPASGIQQLGYNMEHPVFGTGVETPLGIADPTRAAEAARYVRQAMDYLIPRKLIVENLLSNYGSPAAVHVNILSPYYDASIVARDYDPAQAKILLTMAGYDVGVTIPSPTALSDYLLGEPAIFTGTFTIDTVAGQEEGGLVALLQSSSDNVTWTSVAQGITTTGGYYSLSYTPPQTGTYYFRIYLPGVGALTAAQSSSTGPTFEYDMLIRADINQSSPSVMVTVISTDDVLSTLASEVSALTSEVSALTSQVSSLTTVSYLGIGVGVIAIVVAYWFGQKK